MKPDNKSWGPMNVGGLGGDLNIRRSFELGLLLLPYPGCLRGPTADGPEQGTATLGGHLLSIRGKKNLAFSCRLKMNAF